MKQFDTLLKTMDLTYFGTGSHKITFERVMTLLKEEKLFLLDVRSKEECACVSIPFAHNIPTDEIPDRMNEIPKDKTIAVFCSSATRATVVSTYLLLKDYDSKILLDSLSDIVSNFKPGYVLKNLSDMG